MNVDADADVSIGYIISEYDLATAPTARTYSTRHEDIGTPSSAQLQEGSTARPQFSGRPS